MKKILIFVIMVCLLLSSCKNEEVIIDDKLGLALSAENVTDSGLTLVFTQSGGEKTGALETGSWYSLDKFTDGEWTPLETEPLDFAWTMVAYMIKENDTTKFDVNWEWLYGRLPAGRYRINKQVMDFRAPGDYDEYIYSTEFEVAERKSFLAKIIDETTAYMIAEPEEGEEERELFRQIKVVYPKNHLDFLYGKERKVVVYYSGEIDGKGEIVTDDISTEGFRDFEISVLPSGEKNKKLIIKKLEPEEMPLGSGWHYGDENLYYYGLDNVYAEVDGEKLPYDVAIKRGMLSSYAIIAKGNKDVQNGIIEELAFDDGGSQIYKYPEYTIIKYHTLDGNRDVYIGTNDMDITVKDK